MQPFQVLANVVPALILSPDGKLVRPVHPKNALTQLVTPDVSLKLTLVSRVLLLQVLNKLVNVPVLVPFKTVKVFVTRVKRVTLLVLRMVIMPVSLLLATLEALPDA